MLRNVCKRANNDGESEKQMTKPVAFNWKDVGERILRAFYTGAVAAAAAIPVAELTGVVDATNGYADLKHVGAVILTGGLTAAWTAIKAVVGQGRGSDPSNGALR